MLVYIVLERLLMVDQLLSRQARATLEKLRRSKTHPSTGGENGRLSEKVFTYVVENIRSGRFAPGTRITERELARQLKMSHVPVREAIEQLKQHGWVERIPRKGIYARSINDDTIKDIYQLREILEGGAVRIVAEQITDIQLSELHDIINLLEASYQSNNANAFRDADNEFHRLLVCYTGNKRLINIFESVVLQAGCFFFIGASGEAIYTKQAREHLKNVSHNAIYEAVKNGNGDLAEELVRQHIRRGCSMITELRSYLAL